MLTVIAKPNFILIISYFHKKRPTFNSIVTLLKIS
ncbi:MAG: hypothetical protein H6Q19_872 [Bacteroidetes bacterium]|nr:hypothetical protein [Bacteroidota bacterium]